MEEMEREGEEKREEAKVTVRVKVLPDGTKIVEERGKMKLWM